VSDFSKHSFELPFEQQAIWAKGFHPTGGFVEFKKEDVEQSIPERFESIVRMHPDRITVKAGHQVVTYAELNALANRVAHTVLAERGSEAEPVAILSEKGIGQLASMLGVLKAGKFVVLLDPSFPTARIKAVLEDSQASLVITDAQNASLARELLHTRCRLIEFESIDCRTSNEDLHLPISPKAFAFIFYTSGSTGQPKGVVWNHSNLLHGIRLRTNETHACKDDRITFLFSSTANAVTNIFLALLNGAELLPFDVQREGVIHLAGWLVRERISICWISSPLFRNLYETLTGEERFPDLRLIRTASEAVYKTDIDLYKKHFSPNCIFLTGLSSSEAGQLSTYLIDHKTEIAGNEVPVGYPVTDKEILLLNDEGKQVAFNEVGEIVVRSSFLSPGYWRKPELTEAKFRLDPHNPEKRLYYTGDLGLMLPDGCLMHKGRKDFRVKVRGYGVEIAEVERSLRDHASIKDVVVVASTNESGEARLVAYFTSSSQRTPGVSELRSFLKEKLADYMIPAFVRLDALPLTPSGKVDRKALPVWNNSRPVLDTPYLAPRILLEEQLAKIWAEVLDIDQVGIHDNFFDLGGHSLAVTRVITRVIKTFQLDLPIKALFESPTVADMAAIIAQNQRNNAAPEDLDRMLSELESLSDEQAQKLLGQAG
jgi:amino acid adenylation domain-containing protein